MTTFLRATKAKARAGFSLIEIMVAVLVLSLAFLSLGSLAARSLSSNNSAMSQSVATIAMDAIADAMRADRASAAEGAYNNGGQPIVASQCPADTGTLASRQLNQWCTQQLAAPALGGPVDSTRASIDCQNAAAVSCTITITWDGSRGGNAGSHQTVTTTGML